jgi:hypothetical protein
MSKKEERDYKWVKLLIPKKLEFLL